MADDIYGYIVLNKIHVTNYNVIGSYRTIISPSPQGKAIEQHFKIVFIIRYVTLYIMLWHISRLLVTTLDLT